MTREQEGQHIDAGGYPAIVGISGESAVGSHVELLGLGEGLVVQGQVLDEGDAFDVKKNAHQDLKVRTDRGMSVS
jgi:hypothetical protein